MRPLSLLALFGVLLGGCGGDLTEIFACYSLDPAYDGAPKMVNLMAITTDGRLLYDSMLGPPSDGVISQGFVQASADGVRIALSAAIEDQPDPMGGIEPVTVVLVQDATVQFQPGRVVDVTLWLEAACVGVICGSGQTCVAGGCVPEEVPPDVSPITAQRRRWSVETAG